MQTFVQNFIIKQQKCNWWKNFHKSVTTEDADDFIEKLKISTPNFSCLRRFATVFQCGNFRFISYGHLRMAAYCG